MANPSIFSSKLTLIWCESVINALDSSAPQPAFSFLGNKADYANAFDQALTGGFSYPDLQPPWIDFVSQYFWYYYLEQKGTANGIAAWKSLVPFRVKIPMKAGVAPLPSTFLAEGFYYPHGIALAITFSFEMTDMPLNDFVEQMHAVRRSQHTVVSSSTGLFPTHPWPEAINLDLRRIASDLRCMLREAGFGKNVQPVSQTSEPFSIVTVLKGAVDNIAAPVAQNDDVHRALQALSGWSKTWKIDILDPLAAASLQIKTKAPSHIVYSGKRGRSIWFPGLFAQRELQGRTLSCYHRNQVFASLQVESFVTLMAATLGTIDVKPLPIQFENCVRNAAGVLARLWDGNNNIYRSQSAKVQIQERLNDVNAVRKYFSWTELK